MIVPTKNKEKWHSYYAILPVTTIDKKIAFLQRLEARRVYIGYAQDDMCGHSPYRWEYRT